MHRDIVGKWWVIALRGAASILLGIAAFVWPALTLLVLVILLGAYLLVDGVLALVAGGMTRSWLLLVVNPRAGLLALTWLVGAYALFFGVVLVALAFRLRGSRRGVGVLRPSV